MYKDKYLKYKSKYLELKKYINLKTQVGGAILNIEPGTQEIGVNAYAHNIYTQVTIPDTVKNIGPGAFSDNHLTSVIIPDSVETIGSDAFLNNKLTSVTISNSIKNISNETFENNLLKSIRIPDSVEGIGSKAFAINKLESIRIPDSVKYISKEAFIQNNLTSILFDAPSSVETIDSYAFAYNQLQSVKIPNSVKNIGSGAFSNNKLKSITIPDSINKIQIETFSKNQLESVSIPNSVIVIEEHAFSNNYLSSVSIPNSVETIGPSAFSYNRFLTSVKIPYKFRKDLEIIFGPDQFENIVYKYTGLFVDTTEKLLKVLTLILKKIKKPKEQGLPININYKIVDGENIFDIDPTHNVFETLWTNRTEIINKKPFFIYRNITDEAEPVNDVGSDAGGLTSNVFNLLSKFLTKEDSQYFYKYQNYWNIDPRTPRIDKFYFIGQLFGCAIKLRQIIQIDLHPLLLYRMIYNDFNLLTPEEILEIINKFNPELSNTHPFSCFQTPITDTRCNENEDGNPINSEEEKKQVALRYIKGEFSNPNTDSFIGGFRSQINVSKSELSLLPLKYFSQLISGSNIPLTYENLMNYLQFVGFSPEQETSMKELIEQKSAENPEWVKIFLFALTNKNKIPLEGYETTNPLTIELKPATREPYQIHTCSNQMEVRTESLEEYMRSSDKPSTKLYEYLSTKALSSISELFNIA